MERTNDEISKKKNYKNDMVAKHFLQMSESERWYLLRKRDRLIGRNTLFSQHSIQRMCERRITEREIIEAVKYGQIIEYRKSRKDERITVRSTRLKCKHLIVYVSFSIRDNIIVTTYCSNMNDFTKEKNFSKYDESLKVN